MSAPPTSTPLTDAPSAPGGVRPALEWAAVPARLLLAGVLGYAALSKIGDPAATVRAVRAYDLLPDGLATVVGHGLPAFELALAALLLAGVALRLTATVTAVLLGVFLAGIVSAAARGLAIDCGCFGGGGPTDDPAYASEIVRDSLLLAVAVGLAVLGTSRLAAVPRAPLAPQAPPAGSPRTVARRAQVERTRYEAALGRHRGRVRLVGLGAAAALVVAPLTGIAVAEATKPAPPVVVPAAATASGGIAVGSPSAPRTLVVFEDPQCPYCGELERGDSAKAIAAAVDAGALRVEYRLRSFLGEESVRAVSALAAASDEGKFLELHAAVYASQPEERTGGYTTDDLLELGRSVGLTSDRFVQAVRTEKYAGWARQADDRASRDGNTSTPELRLDGKVVDADTMFDAAALTALLA
ncbi:MauE/DoxX family redox-associated membrane protein [Motilibacter deserti]|uniref:Thioredoxin domain-containing protein n=1 Tax=Motilibacter deserti TaxID=2714956 RepID=A0ABX0GXQ3_9ACTN|nr:MauE/DoxX family redox-associated membrane protein [Motilibacter deserti]NHC15607.1 thioredoxin domain-containing protein [Motilibacter deserti]